MLKILIIIDQQKCSDAKEMEVNLEVSVLVFVK